MEGIKHREIGVEELAPYLGVGSQALRKRIQQGWLPVGWKIRKVAHINVISAMFLGDVPVYQESPGVYLPVPGKSTQYIRNKKLKRK